MDDAQQAPLVSVSELEDFFSTGTNAFTPQLPDSRTPLIDMPGVGAVALHALPPAGFSIDLSPDEVLDLQRFDREEKQRARLLSELLFAARDLAEKNILGHTHLDHTPHVWCRECQMNAVNGRIMHASSCSTGRVVRTLDRLQSTAAESSRKAVGCTITPEQPQAEGESSPRGDYGEPWQWIQTPSGAMWIADQEETVIARTVSGSPREARDWAERIVACVNSCAGNSDELLSSLRQAAQKEGRE